MLNHFAYVYHRTTQFLFGWIDPFINYVFNNTMTQIAVDILWFFSKLYVQVRNNVNILSSKYVAVKITTEAIQSAYDHISNLTHNEPKEPADLPWGCIATLENNKVVETYTHFENKDEQMQNYYRQMQTNKSGISIIKTSAAVWCNRCVSDYDGVRPQSMVKFISVVYKHPDMPGDGLEMNVGREWYLVGNELFSAEFVARWLHYQPEPYVFDDRYSIQIVDDQVNVVTLNHKQYVTIEKTTYKIVTV
uniref:Uncharacterized protein n=1 Tax=viral metagenome TaxID=1070528 RepID=A0A6C0KII6_9ZZZZ